MVVLNLGDWPDPLREAVRRARGTIANVLVFSACISILYLAPTLYMMQVYDRVVPTSGFWTLVWLTLLVGMAVGTLTILDNMRLRLLARVGLQLEQQLSGAVLHGLMAGDQAGEKGSARGQAIRDFDQLRQVISSPTALALLDLPFSPIFLVVAFVIHPVLGLMICAGGAILISLAWVNERAARGRSKQAHAAISQSYAIQADLAGKAEVIRSLGMPRAAVAMQQRARRTGIVDTVKLQIAGGFYSSLVKFVRLFFQSLSLGVGAWLAISGQISIGTIIAASVLLSRALQPIEQVVGGWAHIGQARQGLASLKAALAQATPDTRRPMMLPDPQGRLEAINLTLRNPAGTAFLMRGVNLVLEPGQVTGVIGASGAGKSTLARLLCGAIMPEVGEVRIDGATFADWDREQLACHIGYMPQETALLPGTISENISRFAALRGEDQAAIEAKVVAAAQRAGIHQLILKLPDGYATRLGTPAFTLSGGQAQRIAMARAAYGDPHILILDEPNAALDAEGERALMHLVETARAAGRVVLIVAHNPFVLNLADRLVVMANGTIERAGTREQILQDLREAAERSNVVAMRREH